MEQASQLPDVVLKISGDLSASASKLMADIFIPSSQDAS
jgi:hypothetical protein